MKMPSINVVFKEKGISAIERSERGIILMLLKEETLPSVTEVNLYTADDIPKELSDSNREQLELALRGYVNSPKKVIAEIISSEAEDYTDILKAIENKRFDYLVIPDIGTSHIDTIATWVKGMRTNKDKMIKAVLPDCTADTEGVINFVNKTIRTKSRIYTTAQYCSRIAGIIAGTPMTISCTYAPLPEVIGCDVWTKEEMDTMAGAGKLFFFFDGEKVKLARGINSLVTTVQDKGTSFQKIKLVDLMDMMHDDIRTTAQDHYLGKYANSYANRCLLVTAIQGYLDQLAQEGLLEQDQNTAYIDVESTKIWLESNGKYTKAELADMSDMDIKLANIGSNVFIAVKASLLDAMEDVTITINI